MNYLPPSYMLNPVYYPSVPMQGPNFPQSGLANILRPIASADQSLAPVADLPLVADQYSCVIPIPQPSVGTGELVPMITQSHAPYDAIYRANSIRSYNASQQQYNPMLPAALIMVPPYAFQRT
jgi:hypothetical protein